MVRSVLLLSQNLIVSSFTKIQYLFWYWLFQVVLEKRLLGIFRIFFLGCACIQAVLTSGHTGHVLRAPDFFLF